ncbi:MAG: hypothetical protein ACW9W3_05795 [Candidatus Nitrosopumilus sp. bin_68KS]
MSMQNDTIHVESRVVCLHMTGFNEMNANMKKFSEDPHRIQMISNDIILRLSKTNNNVLYVGSKNALNLYKNHLKKQINSSRIKIICSDKLESHSHIAYVDRKMNVKNQNHSKIIDYFGVPNQHCKSH